MIDDYADERLDAADQARKEAKEAPRHDENAPLSEMDELLFALVHNHDVMVKMRTCEAIAIEALESIATVQGPPAALAGRASKALEAIRAAYSEGAST